MSGGVHSNSGAVYAERLPSVRFILNPPVDDKDWDDVKSDVIGDRFLHIFVHQEEIIIAQEMT